MLYGDHNTTSSEEPYYTNSMKTITIELTDQAYEIYQAALDRAQAPMSVDEWLTQELNELPDVFVAELLPA